MAAASYNVLRPILIGLLVIIIEGLDTTYGSDYDDKLKTCKVGNDENCRLGPYCFTFSSTKEDIYAPDNICNTKLGDDKTKCQLPIVSVKKSDDDWFTVVLMGSVPKNQPPSWFAIGFSKSPTIMKDKNFAVVCFSDNRKPEVFNLAGNPKNAARATNQGSIRNSESTLVNGYLVCKFDLNKKPKNDGPEALDLIENKKGYYIGLAHGEIKSTVLVHHKATGIGRGSSLETMEFFKYLDTDKSKEKKKNSQGSPRVTITTSTTTNIGIIGIILCAIVV